MDFLMKVKTEKVYNKLEYELKNYNNLIPLSWHANAGANCRER